MLLNEFLYFNDRNNNFAVDRRYEAGRDSSVVKQGDTRKIRLTLRQLNQLRMASEAHEAESASEQSFISQMYATPVDSTAA